MDGYFIGKIEVKGYENEVIGITFKTLKNQSNAAIIFDKISDYQLLAVILIKSENNLILQKTTEDFKNLLFQKSFSEIELNNYLAFSGDKNPVHFGENPIVPGIMILKSFLQNLHETPNFFKIKFHNPLHLLEVLQVFKTTENESVGITNGQIIFKIIT
ncbi:MAG: hypothetical protein V4683_02525 [Bacteroidota bacterium]